MTYQKVHEPHQVKSKSSKTNSNAKSKSNKSETPPFVQSFLEAAKYPTKFDNHLQSKPPWFDEARFKRGQRIARENIFYIAYSEMMCLLLSYTKETALTAFIFTGKSDTTFKAYKRYLASILRTASWYENDPWDVRTESYKNLATVNRLHNAASKQMMAVSKDEMLRRSTVKDPKFGNTALLPVLLKDFGAACPAINPKYVRTVQGTEIWLSQQDMIMGQFPFLALLALYHKKKFGMCHVSDEEISDFLYVWRCMGHLLGVDDKYNLCLGSLEEIRKKVSDMLWNLLVPMLQRIDTDYEHMTRCLVQGASYFVGPFGNYEVLLCHACHILEIDVPRLEKQLSYFQRFTLFAIEKVLIPACRVKIVNSFVNKFTWHSLKFWKMFYTKIGK